MPDADSYADAGAMMKTMFSMAPRGVRFFALALAALSGTARAQDTVPPKVEMTTPGGVNIGDGSYTMNVTDLSIGPLTLQRFMQGVSPIPPDDPFFGVPYFGTGMTHNFDIYVAPNFIHPSGGVPGEYHPVVHIGNSASGVYEQGSLGGADRVMFEMNDDARSGRLEWASNAYKYTDSTGTIYRFNTGTGSSGIVAGGSAGPDSRRVASITFPDGRVQTFSYDASKRLKMVSDSSGYAIIFDNNAAGDVVAACGFNLSQDYVTTSTTCASAPLKVSYGYTGAGLSSFTDVTNLVTSYTSVTTPGPPTISTYCIKPAGYVDCKIKNILNAEGRVTQQIIDGSTWNTSTSISVFSNDPEYVPGNCDTDAGFTGPGGTGASVWMTKSSPCDITDPSGNRTSYTWTGGKLYNWYSTPTLSEGTMLTQAWMPEGDTYLAEYWYQNQIIKQTWKAKPGSPLADRVMQYGYSCPGGVMSPTCAKPIWKTDAKGNQTDTVYTSWGAVASEMQPPPVKPSLWVGGTPASDKVRLLKLNDYVQKQAYVKNSGGTLVATGVSIWLPNSETLCQTVSGSSSPVCDTAAPMTVTTYTYGAIGTANTLLLRSKVVAADWGSLKTCYGYDPKGRKIWERSPRGLGACP